MSIPCALRDESLVGVKSHESDEGKLGSQEMQNNIKHNMHAVHKIYVTIYLNKKTLRSTTFGIQVFPHAHACLQHSISFQTRRI